MNSETSHNLAEWNARRKRAVELRLEGRPLHEIREETGLSAPTVIAAHKAYLDGGWDAVSIEGRGRKSGTGRILTPEKERAVHTALLKTPPGSGLWTPARASEWIEEQLGVLLEDRTLARYLARWELTRELWRRTAEATEAGRQWWADALPVLTMAARANGRQVVWCCVQPIIADTSAGTHTTLLQAQTLKGRSAWRQVAGEATPEAVGQFLSQLSEELATPLAVALNAPPALVRTLSAQPLPRASVHTCPIGAYPIDAPVAAPASALATFPAVVADATTRPPTPIRPTSEATPAMPNKLTHLQDLEAESIHILREVVAECERPVMLYSIGKDSSVMLHLARKAFYPAPPPFPLLHVDTTWKFREMYAMRERIVAELEMELLVHQNPEAIELGVNPFVHGSQIHTDMWKTQGLKQALTKYGFDAAFGGARRDEEKSRAKERIFSFRSEQHRWDPKNQRPELWHLYNTRVNKGESIRVFPISNWTELDIWQYIHLENIPIVPLYFAKERPVVERDGSLIMVDDERMPLRPGETPKMRKVRFRTLGCYPLTGAVESNAQTLPEVIQEMLLSRTSERQGRVIDHDTSASMEKKKQEGYF